VIVVDTTVLVYAVGQDHPLREPCRVLVEAVQHGDVRATTTVEVIQEFAHVRARRRPRPEAAALAQSYAELFAPLLTVDADDLVAGLKLFSRTEALGPFDAVLAATAQRRDSEGIVSADRAFAKVRGLRHLDPAEPGFAEHLRGQG
jgi:predicted nucleic acid-binding protein